MKKKIVFILSVILLLSVIFNVMPVIVIAETKYSGSLQLYYLDQYYEKYISIPNNFLKEYQIKLDKSYNHIRYSVDGDSITVDNSGIVKPRASETIVIGTLSGTTGNRLTYTEGVSVVTVYADNDVFTYEIIVADYAEYYVTELMQNYIDQNIKSSMSGYEKLQKISEFICRYDYNVAHSGSSSMIITGEGGDCWASADGIVRMCKMAGLKARYRSDESVSIFRGGHIQPLIMADGKYYIAEANVSNAASNPDGRAPRDYYISEYTNLFRYSRLSDGTAEIKEYLGFDPDIVIPQSIDGYTISKIGSQSFYLSNGYMDEKIASVTIPGTVTTIGTSAFYNCREIKEIYIPASVSKIEMSAFSGCSSLTLDISKNSNYFYADNKNGILFSADRKTLLTAYNLKTVSYTVPDGVIKIADAAFYNCQLAEIYFPDTLEDIGYQAFTHSRMSFYDLYIPESVKGIGYGAFYGTSLRSITIMNPACVINNTIENDLYLKEDGNTLGGSNGTYLFGLKNSTLEAYADKYGSGVYGVRNLSFPNREEIGYRFFPIIAEDTVVTIDSGLCGENASWKITWSLPEGFITKISGTGTITKLTDINWREVNQGNRLAYHGQNGERYYLYYDVMYNIIIEDGIQSIGERTFADNWWVKSITIPGSITEIGNGAFSRLPDTSKIYVPDKIIKSLIINNGFDENRVIAVEKPNSDNAGAWAHDGIISAIKKGFVPKDLQSEYTNVITREEFCRMAVKFVEYKLGKNINIILSEKGLERNINAFNDTGDPDILAAFALGITSGTGNNQFTPNGQFTREQAAAMIMNMCKIIGMDIENPPNSGFTDIASVSNWAVDGVNFCYANGIMGGTSATSPVFNPKGMYTRQESIVTFDRIK